MQKIRLGTSDLFVSKLGLGCMSLGTEKKNAEMILKTAFEEGINYFDTADLYDYGENEAIIGSSLRSIRDKIIIATKVGNKWNNKTDEWRWDPSKRYIKEAVKESLKRLNTEYIDLYQLHGGTIDDPTEETIEAFEELIKEGYIRYYGISSIRPNVIRKFANTSNIVSAMMQYSILDRRPEEEILSFLLDRQISIITRGTLAKGLLSSRSLSNILSQDKGYLDYSTSELKTVLKQLKLQFNRSLNEIAIQYNLSHPSIASVIVGASSIEQLKENCKAVNSQPLTKDELNSIQSLTKKNIYLEHRS